MKRINLNGPHRSLYYWYVLCKQEQVISRRKKWNGGVMVRGAFNENCINKLVVLKVNQNAKKYVQIFGGYSLPFAKRITSNHWIFQQKNVVIHTSKASRDQFYAKKKLDMDRPACILDLNPIKNLWAFYQGASMPKQGSSILQKS